MLVALFGTARVKTVNAPYIVGIMFGTVRVNTVNMFVWHW